MMIIMIISIILFLIVFIILRKIQPEKNHLKNPRLWILSTFSSLFIYIGLFFIWITLSTQYTHKNFNSNMWLSDIESRYEYADDLIDNELLIGKTKSEVVLMLGVPDSENQNTMTYYIGFSPRHFIAIDPDWLEIHFIRGVVFKVLIYNS